MKRGVVIFAVAAVIVAVGLTRVQLDVDIFNLLPSGSSTVEGLRLYQRTFGTSHELMISVRAQDAQLAADASRSLAAYLETNDLGSHVLWQSPFREDREALGELLAYLWLNQTDADFRAMADRFDEDRRTEVLADTLERIATSMRPQEVAALAHDPYGLTRVAESSRGMLPDGASDPFSGPDGSFRILFLGAPDDVEGFWRVREWVSKIRTAVDAWQTDFAADTAVAVRITGNPAFVDEVGSGLLRDVQFAAVGTLALVATLFWLVHRRWRPLLWLVSLLLLVLVATMAVGGIFIGSLNAVSLGFAAILMGLAADYGLILYQERLSHPDWSVVEVRRAVAPSILWAAVTTAGAFFMIGRSSLPGVTQLGILVGTGVLLAAVVMLSLFLKPLGNPMPAGRASAPRIFRLGGTAAWTLTLAMVVFSTGVLLVSRPRVETATDNLGPKNAEARAALREIEREIGGFDDALWLIVTGSDESEVTSRLTGATEHLQRGREAGVLDVVATPVELWPNVGAQSENRRSVGRLVEQWPAARQAALDAGFETSALGLSEAVFESWGRFAATEGTVWPATDGGRWLMSRFAAREDGRFVALGRVAASAGAEHQQIEDLAAAISREEGVELVGWSLLSSSLLEVMRRDISRVLLPMTVILLVMLGLAFRRPQEVLLSVASLALALAGLLAIMSLLGWPWNLMNVMALPLLFGAGVDYAIHIQHALRRYGGDVVRVRNTVGRAILLCAASTAAGFGTLGMGSNAGIATLGRVCAVGVVSAALVSVFLLPQWWRSVAGDRRSPLE